VQFAINHTIHTGQLSVYLGAMGATVQPIDGKSRATRNPTKRPSLRSTFEYWCRFHVSDDGVSLMRAVGTPGVRAVERQLSRPVRA
jgi:hypothetical protein